LVPEPSSLTLAFAFFGLSGLALVRWRTLSPTIGTRGPETNGQITRHPEEGDRYL